MRPGSTASPTWPDDSDVFAYFNNDPGGAAVVDAERLRGLAERAGRTVPRPANDSGAQAVAPTR